MTVVELANHAVFFHLDNAKARQQLLEAEWFETTIIEFEPVIVGFPGVVRRLSR